jgi:hypothetical protein
MPIKIAETPEIIIHEEDDFNPGKYYPPMVAIDS